MTSYQDIDILLTSGTALLKKCLSVLFSDAETFQIQKKVLHYIQYIFMVKTKMVKKKTEEVGLCSWSVHIGRLQNTHTCVQNTSKRKILQSNFQDWWRKMSGEGCEKTKLKFVSPSIGLFCFQGSRLTFLQTSPVASDNFDFTSQNQFSTSQNFQWIRQIWVFFANSAEHRAISTRNPRKRLSSMKAKT